MLKTIMDYINNNHTMSSFGISALQYEELSMETMPRAAIYSEGGSERGLYIGGDTTVDFNFRIVYHCICEDTSGRMVPNGFFEDLANWLNAQAMLGFPNLSLGEGKKAVGIRYSPASKTETKSDNSQVWSGSFTLTYDKGE